MKEYKKLTFPELIRVSAKNFNKRPAVAFVGEKPVTYGEFHKNVNALIAFLEKLNVEPGDRVAILSTNSPHWGMVYFAVVSMGAVVVPLLPDFSSEEIKNTLRHSRSKVLFVSKSLIPKVKSFSIHSLVHKVSMEEFKIIGDSSDILFDNNATPLKQYDIQEDDLAAIIYTSGTTGRSKGVMLSHKNIIFDAIKASKFQLVTSKDRFLSVLPLSHTYENTIGFVLPLIYGAAIYYLKKIPSPSVLIPAMEKVRPTLMLTVPLIIEKIYRSKILPAFNDKQLVKKLYSKPFIRKRMNKLAGKKLLKIFGGELKFFGVGGAKINEEVEKFLLEAKFPYAVGYGLTETSPLLAGFGKKDARLQSAGTIIDDIEVIIHDPDPETGEGEIWARGPNVMKGYYKEPELTKQVLTDDGWFKTGDLGVFDKDGYLYIKGRSKNVIIGAGGENIYPEEIEAVINNYENVEESVVVEQNGKLVALVHLNWDALQEKFQNIQENFENYLDEKYPELRNEIKKYINERVSRFSKIQDVNLVKEEFVKTATKKIKRFLYKKEQNGKSFQ